MHFRLPLSLELYSVAQRFGVAILLAYSSLASAGVIPVLENGKLIGADNVQVGSLGVYKVRINAGACTELLLNGCDPKLFAFKNAETALQAAQALLDQVFVGYYDDVSLATRGCGVNGCTIHTPYAVGPYMLVAYTNNWPERFTFPGGFSPLGYEDEAKLGTGPAANYPGYNGIAPLWAAWERQADPVSVTEPSPLATLVLGLSLAGLIRRREARRAST